MWPKPLSHTADMKKHLLLEFEIQPNLCKLSRTSISAFEIQGSKIPSSRSLSFMQLCETSLSKHRWILKSFKRYLFEHLLSYLYLEHPRMFESLQNPEGSDSDVKLKFSHKPRGVFPCLHTGVCVQCFWV